MADQYDPYTYLQTFDGDPAGFLAAKKAGQRLGQAFVNSCNDNDQWILSQQATFSGSSVFYSDNREEVRSAVKHLLEFGS